MQHGHVIIYIHLKGDISSKLLFYTHNSVEEASNYRLDNI